jgi:hypothetical protein
LSWLALAAIVADLLALGLVAAGFAVVAMGRLRFSMAGLVVRVNSPWRLWLIAVVVLVVRSLVVPRSGRRTLWRLLPGEERALFGEEARPAVAFLRRLAVALAGFSVLVAALTWPQVRHMDSVPDFGDPLFSIWRISWISHQMVSDPMRLFDTNIFYPERLTLAYSDSMLVPSLIGMPLLWLGLGRAVVYNLVFLSGFVLSGVTMYLLARALTGRSDASIVAGVIFALYPYRLEHYSHLELQMTMWMPLALWGLHRTISRGRIRDGLLTGLAYALQMLSSMYYGLFFAVYVVIVGAALWLGRRCPGRPLIGLAAGAALAAVLVAPVGSRYLANQSLMSTHGPSAVRFYSAEPKDYLESPGRSLIYAAWSRDPQPERLLFPRLTPVVLAGVALWPPLSIVRIGYAAALAVAVDASFGVHGRVFPTLIRYVPGYSGLRVPARFSLLAGMTLALLSGFGLLRLVERWPRAAWFTTAAVLTGAVVEALPVITLQRVWPEPPGIYSSLPRDSKVILAEFPMATTPPTSIAFSDSTFEYFSTFHWRTMVNGDSGFYPPSYMELLEKERTFPSEDSLAYLRSRGVTHITLNGAFIDRTLYQDKTRILDARLDLELVAATPWEGSEARLYRFR